MWQRLDLCVCSASKYNLENKLYSIGKTQKSKRCQKKIKISVPIGEGRKLKKTGQINNFHNKGG